MFSWVRVCQQLLGVGQGCVLVRGIRVFVWLSGVVRCWQIDFGSLFCQVQGICCLFRFFSRVMVLVMVLVCFLVVLLRVCFRCWCLFLFGLCCNRKFCVLVKGSRLVLWRCLVGLCGWLCSSVRDRVWVLKFIRLLESLKSRVVKCGSWLELGM